MIKKFLLFFIIFIVSVWVIVAHLIKGQDIALIRNLNSDNIKVTFEDTSISGFPFSFKVKFISPKVTIVSQNGLQELLVDEILIKHNLFLSSAEIEIGENFTYTESSVDSEEKYSLYSEKKIKFNIKFNNNLLIIDDNSDLIAEIHSIYSDFPSITCFYEDKEKFKLDLITLKCIKEKIDNLDVLKIKLSGEFLSTESDSPVNKARVFVDMNYFINEALENLEFNRRVELNNLQMKIDNASMDVKGVINLSRSKLPNGKLNFVLVQYNNIVDNLVPDGFIFSKTFIKKIISKASLENDKKAFDNANFELTFSEKGINVGKWSLSELRNSELK